MKRDGRSTHLRVRMAPPADASVTAGTILHASNLPLTVWSGPLPRWRPTPTASLPCSSRNSSVSALTAALGCSPTSCAPAWSTPSATRCRAWWKSRGQPSIPDQRRSSHRRAQPRRQAHRRRHRTRGRKHPRPPAAGRNLLLRRRRPRTLRRNRRRSRRHRENRRLVRLRWVPADRHNVHVVGKTAVTSSCRGSTKSSPTSKDGREASNFTVCCVASICRPISMSSLSLQPSPGHAVNSLEISAALLPIWSLNAVRIHFNLPREAYLPH